MLSWLFKWLILSAIIILISHYLYEFYLSSHSPPKLRDIQNERNAEYEMLRKMVANGGEVCQPTYPPTSSPQLDVDPSLPTAPTNQPPPSPNDKDALKAFMRQMNDVNDTKDTNGTSDTNDSTPIR